MNILVTPPVDEGHRRILTEACPGGSFRYVRTADVTPEDIAPAEVVIGNVPHAMLQYAENLRLLHLGSAGTDGYPERMPKGAQLTNSSGAYGLAIAEHMLAELMAIIKKLYLYEENQKQSLWRDEGPVTSVYGATVLSVGMGDIGGEFLKRCKALGAHTIGVRRSGGEKPDWADEIYTPDMLDELLPKADFAALSLPATAGTIGLFDARRLSLMKQGAVLINVGRGSTVDGNALAYEANRGHIYAALDVTDPEPLPPDHPLWTARNVHITPHISGFFHLRETLNRIIRIGAENLRRYVNGEPLLNLVDPETGYRLKENRAEGFYES